MLRLTYLVCATPRSGSTLLCQLLKSTGVAGRPEEYFEARSDTGLPSHPGDYLENLPRTGAGIRDDTRPPSAPGHSSLVGIASYRVHLERTFSAGTTDNGVFGAKIMWRHLAELQRLASELPEYRGLDAYELLERLFEHPRFVWVTRHDKVRQAVSLWRALQTRMWRLEHAGAQPSPAQLHYRFEGIDHLVRSLTADDEGWRAFFHSHAIEPLHLVYEDHLERDPGPAILSILDHLGIEPPASWQPGPLMQRQADSLSDEWVAAYHRDASTSTASLR